VDEIVIKYSYDLKSLLAEQNKLEAELVQTEKISKKSADSVGKMYTSQTAKVKEATNATNQQTKAVTSLSDKLNEIANNLPFANQAKSVLGLGSALTSSGNAAKGASVGIRVFSSALLATGIPILIAAIVALIAYFKRTDEGATRLAGAMAAFNSVIDLITGSVIGFGEATFKAFRSIDDFKAGLSDLGDFIVNNLFNRVKGFITLFEAAQLAIGGDFEKAGLRFIDATTQIATGVTDITTKTSDFVKQAEAAALAAYEWEKAMDALQDKIREDSTVIAENDRAIAKLLIASKNKTIEDEKALGFLDEATRLEKENLAITLQNETAKLKLIQERNKRESDSINQDIKAGETRRSINDDLAQEERDQINKLIQIQAASDALLEKAENRKDGKREEIFQNQIKRIQAEEILRENAAKEQFINGTINAEEFEQELYNIKLQGLQNQKELLVSNSRDIVEVDKAILDLELQNLIKHNKDVEALEKKRRDDKAKADKAANDAFLAAVEERLKEEDEKAKEHEAKLLAIKQTGFALADELASGFADIAAQKRQMELDEELRASQKETDKQQEDLQKQFDNGLISEEQFNAKKLALDKKQSDKDAEIKRKQFDADKRAALVQVAIDTALAIAKAFAQLGPVGGALGAALAAAMGLAQAAIISAQPTPKFEKGGKVKGKRHSQGGTLIEAEDSEWVIKRDQSIRHDKLLENINNGDADKYINSAYVVPAIHKHENEIRVRNRERIKKERQDRSNTNNFDTSRMESYLKKNNTVAIKNFSELASIMTKEKYFNSKLFQ
jgi:hypothetical protein